MTENYTELEIDSIDIAKEIRYYLFFWPWFLACIFLMGLSAFLYLRYSQTVYETTATLQVKDANSDASSFLSLSSSSMFNFSRVKIDNHITQISSMPNLRNVVKALDLQTTVFSLGRVKNNLRFGPDIPFDIEFKTDATNAGFNLNYRDNKAILELDDKLYNLSVDQAFETEDFRLTLNEIPEDNTDFLITRTTETNAMAALAGGISISASSEEGDNIDIALKGSNKKRNEAIINSLIKAAHAEQVSEKRQIYTLSIDFINNRLRSIVNEIDSLSLKTTGFKSDNLIFSPELQTSSALSNLANLELDKFNLTTQLELAKSLKQNLRSQSNFSLLPSNIGINSGNVNELVVAYNTLVLERNGLLSGATEKNPVVVQLSTQLTDLKQNILRSIDNYLDNLGTSLSEFKEFKNSTSAEVAKIPKLEATLLAFQRKFQIAESLYLFLLKKYEEASISYEATLPDTRVINYAFTSPIPVAPKSKIIFLGAIFLGLLIPFGTLYILKLIDTKLHTREDLEKALPSLAILGEVPFVSQLGTTKDSRGIFAESARVIRSNISFKLVGEGSKVILSTSSIKGEGKTMSAFNIAASYAATGKKVLMVGADLRNPRLHDVLEIERLGTEKGLSSFLVSDSNEVISDHIFSTAIFNSSMDVLLSGPIPPNPAELLGSKKFESVLNILKENYDYVIIDSAPLVLVSDTLPLLKYADLTLYTTRAHYTEKKLTDFIKGLVNDKKVKNIGLIFNGVKSGGTSYWKYGYSYRYSYQYKYNFGYGYGYEEDN
jgi:capsular exopolysaccharide synthesis family protein